MIFTTTWEIILKTQNCKIKPEETDECKDDVEKCGRRKREEKNCEQERSCEQLVDVVRRRVDAPPQDVPLLATEESPEGRQRQNLETVKPTDQNRKYI